MKFALHGMVTLYSNLLSDIRIAKDTGYTGLEIHTEKLWRYLKVGGTAEALASALQHHCIQPSAIDIIGHVEASTNREKQQLLRETEQLVILANHIKVPTIQLNAFEGLNALSEKENIMITAKNIKEIAKIGAKYNIQFQYEGAAWTPIHSLDSCLALVDAVSEDNFGLVIDFWHFWASHGATPDDIAKLDKKIIYGVHCSGGIRPTQIQGKIHWDKETLFRGYFPKDTDDTQEMLPVQEWVYAIKNTGYDGWVSGEFLNEMLWEQDNVENARMMRKTIMYVIQLNNKDIKEE